MIVEIHKLRYIWHAMKAMKVLICLILLSLGSLSAQIQVTNAAPYNNPDHLVQNVLLGPGVPFLPSFPPAGNSPQIGLFTNGNSFGFGIDSCIVMVSGNATDAHPGAPFSTAFGPTPDADLASMLAAIGSTNSAINDGSFIEFDFVATGDSVSFKYIFASYEYSGYTCSSFNDAFGFFLTGVGINGNPNVSTVNLAQVPFSNPPIPVAVNTLNQGFPSGSSDAACLAANPNYVSSASWYVSNTGAPNVNVTGYTVPLRAKASVQCGFLYHIKLAISDVSDNALHSMTFLEAGSFRVPSIQYSGSNNHNNSFQDSVAVEGCNSSYFKATKGGSINDRMVVHFTKTGSAIEGVDYMPFADSLVIAAGSRSDSIPIFFYDDGVAEGVEELLINTLQVITPCYAYPAEQISFKIRDRQDILSSITLQGNMPDTIDCAGTPIQLFASASGGDGFLSSAWETGSTNAFRWDTIQETTTYYYYSWDECSADSTTDSLTVYVRTAADLQVRAEGASACSGDSVQLRVYHEGGIEPVFITWFDGRNDSVRSFAPNRRTYYSFSVADACGEIIRDSVLANIFPQVTSSFVALEDPAAAIGMRFTNYSQNGDFYYWEFGDGDTSSLMHPKHTFPRPGFYSVRLNVTDANGCFASNELRIEVTQEFDLFIPTAFTPNNDGMNEFFEIKGGGFREYKVAIFNRWGEQVFYSEDLSLAWDGTFKGSDAPTGVYYYSIFLVLNDGKLHSEKGSVSIIR